MMVMIILTTLSQLYEGKSLMYRSPARRKNMNIPETILYAHDDSPIPEEAKQDDFYISAEKYNPQVLYCTIFCTVLYCTVQPAADAAHGAAARGGEVRAQHAGE